MAAKPIPTLTVDQIEEFMERILQRHRLEKIIKTYGFTTRTFHKYCDQNPSFVAELDRTKEATCRFIEDDIYTVAQDYDPKAARVHLEALKSLLVYFNPKKYSQKIDVSVNQTISIRANVDGANSRVSELVRDVTPTTLITGS